MVIEYSNFVFHGVLLSLYSRCYFRTLVEQVPVKDTVADRLIAYQTQKNLCASKTEMFYFL